MGACKGQPGSASVDGQRLEGFAAQVDQKQGRLQRELQEDSYQPNRCPQVQIPKAGKPGEFRTLGIPIIYDRVCQQALLNRLEPIFDDANFSDIDESDRPKTPCATKLYGEMGLISSLALHLRARPPGMGSS